MIKFENLQVVGWEAAVRGMRNPLNSWDKSDSSFKEIAETECLNEHGVPRLQQIYFDALNLGPNDLDLMKRLRNAGTDHRKFMRMITVYVDITAPLYWWKEFDTYKVGTVANSCSTMHKIHEKEFTLEDFSCEHLFPSSPSLDSTDILDAVIEQLNKCRKSFLETKDKKYWWQMIQLLPTSYNQKRTVSMNYEVLANIYKSRKDHKLDEWSENITVVDDIPTTNCWLPNGEMYVGFCDWIKTLPYSEFITGDFGNVESCNGKFEEE